MACPLFQGHLNNLWYGLTRLGVDTMTSFTTREISSGYMIGYFNYDFIVTNYNAIKIIIMISF